MATLKERAEKIFAKNQDKTEVHFTSDGMPFFILAIAEGHASRQKDRTITTINKDGNTSTAVVADPALQPEISEEEKGNVAVNPVAEPVAEAAPASEVKELATEAAPVAEAAPEVKKEAAKKPDAKKSVTPKPEK